MRCGRRGGVGKWIGGRFQTLSSIGFTVGRRQEVGGEGFEKGLGRGLHWFSRCVTKNKRLWECQEFVSLLTQQPRKITNHLLLFHGAAHIAQCSRGREHSHGSKKFDALRFSTLLMMAA